MSSDWDELTIDDLKAPTKNAIAMGPFGSRIRASNFVNKGIPVIKGGNLNGDFISEDNFLEFRVSKEKTAKTKKILDISEAMAFPRLVCPHLKI